MYKFHTIKCCFGGCENQIVWEKLITQRGLCSKHYNELQECGLSKKVSYEQKD